MKKKGFSDVVLGLQYGDEGKARVVDYLAKNYDIIARFNGGANAGHTIKNEKGNISLNQIPSGIFYPDKTLYIGSGCVVNVEKLASEIEKLKKIGIDLKHRLRISCQASIIQPHHILMDELLGKVIGTTKNGIGPCYSDRAIRMHGKHKAVVSMGDLHHDKNNSFKTIEENLKYVRKTYKFSIKNYKERIDNLKAAFSKIEKFIEPDPLYMEKRVEEGASVLFEGAQSVMLDVVKGSVPFVTSSNTTAAAAYVGGDLSQKYHRKTIGVAKALMSRVGNGPFVSEFGGVLSEKYCMALRNGQSAHSKTYEAGKNVNKLLISGSPLETGIALRILSGEYGTVTQRPRRIGIFDLVQLAYATKMNGVDELVINKCDLLREYARTQTKKIPLVTRYTLHRKQIDYVPASITAHYNVKPQIEYRESFTEDLVNVRSFNKLPKTLKGLVREVERTTACKVVGLGVGPERKQYISI